MRKNSGKQGTKKSKKIVHIRMYSQIVMQYVSRVRNAMAEIRTKETQETNMHVLGGVDI